MTRTRVAHFLYKASLFFLILLTSLCIAISAADVIIQALTDRTESGSLDYRNLMVVTVSYLLLAVVSLSFSCSRVLSVRAALQDIPKIYIPIKQDDLPKDVYSHIQQKLEEVKQIRKSAEPRPEDIGQTGWGRPGDASFEGVDFKRAISRTPAIIEQAAIQVQPEFARPNYVSVRQYIQFLIQQNFIDEQLGQVYVEGYERARFGQTRVSQEEYLDIMKHLAAILHHMGYRLHNGSQSQRQGSESTTSSLSRSTVSQQRETSAQQQQQYPNGPRDDDVASLAQSVATWTSRSTTNTQSRQQYLRSVSQRTGGRDQHIEDTNYDDDDDYDRQMRDFIYYRLMMDRNRGPM